jgi:dipeptidyl aminopeptidase/acylaminoacyl peptidase
VVDAYSPAGQAWVDHGFAFLDVNFRGSTGRGRQFFEEIWGRVGELELDDIAAAADWLISSGIARRDALVVTGASYGGFMTLLALGRQPERWAAGIAEVAIADWSIAYRDASAALQAAFRSWFGGEPGEVEERYRASSPITYVDGVRAPVLIRQARNDSRTPAAQLETYADRLRSRGADFELDWFDTGHFLHADADEMAHKVAFLRARGIAGE